MHRISAPPTRFAPDTLVCSCSWSRFDDLRDDPPVVRLDAPVDIDRFGARLASARLDQGGGLILVGGDPETSLPLASYVVADDRPSTSPQDRGFCCEACLSGRSISALRTVAGHQDPCFLIGVGTRSGVTGRIGRCSDGTDFALDVPHDNTQSQTEPRRRDVVGAALAGHPYPGFIQHARCRLSRRPSLQPQRPPHVSHGSTLSARSRLGRCPRPRLSLPTMSTTSAPPSPSCCFRTAIISLRCRRPAARLRPPRGECGSTAWTAPPM